MTNYKYKFSISTATHNGAATLPNVYQCLKEQTYKDFEWVIVDDGSTDNTEEVCKAFMAENVFPIKYQRLTKNGGKHVAVRTAIKIVEGQYLLGLDDDDTYFPNALEVFKKHWDALESRDDYDSFFEVRARVTTDGKTLYGKALPADVFDSNYNDMNYRYHYGPTEMIGCRKVEVQRTIAAVPDHFLFEEYCTNFSEGIRWSRAARKYKTRFVSDIVRYYHRGEQGRLSSSNRGGQSISRRYNSLVGEIYAQNEQRDLMLKYSKKRYLRNIFALSYHSVLLKRNAVRYIHSTMDKMLIILMYPCAYVLSVVRK